MRQNKAADQATEEAMDWFIHLQDKPDRGTRDAFARWRGAAMAHHEAFRRIERLMASPAMREASRRDAQRLAATTKPHAGRKWMKYAAGVAAALLLVLGYFAYPALLLRAQADYLTAAGEQKTITLPDGSLMRLNTASAATLDFTDGKRHVWLLAGEAYFDVRSDPAHPFAVTARFSETTVTGTSFAVRSAAEEDVILLERGRVAVSRLTDPLDTIELDPGQAVSAGVKSLSQARAAEADAALAWRDGRVIFREEGFSTALAELDRYYGGAVFIANARLDAMKVSGSYRIDDPETAILTLAAAAGARETRLPGSLIILY